MLRVITISTLTKLTHKWQDGRAREKSDGLNDVSLGCVQWKNLFLGFNKTRKPPVTRLAWTTTIVLIHARQSITCKLYHMSL